MRDNTAVWFTRTFWKFPCVGHVLTRPDIKMGGRHFEATWRNCFAFQCFFKSVLASLAAQLQGHPRSQPSPTHTCSVFLSFHSYPVVLILPPSEHCRLSMSDCKAWFRTPKRECLAGASSDVTSLPSARLTVPDLIVFALLDPRVSSFLLHIFSFLMLVSSSSSSYLSSFLSSNWSESS